MGTSSLAAIIGGVLAVIIVDAALVMLVPRGRQEKLFLLGAAIYNIGGGLASLLLVISILMGFYKPSLSLQNSELELVFQLLLLFSLFFGWVAIIFGIGYLQSARGKAPARTFLLYGGAIKYWVFVIGAVFYCRLPDVEFFGFRLPDVAFVGGGLMNLLFAVMFTILLIRKADKAETRIT